MENVLNAKYDQRQIMIQQIMKEVCRFSEQFMPLLKQLSFVLKYGV